MYHRIGEKLSDAMVFAARAHAVFDIDELAKAASTNELFLSPHRRGLMSEFQTTERVFDSEHPKSAAILNEIIGSYDARSSGSTLNRISEFDLRRQ